MGVAAYSRGSEAIRQQLKDDRPQEIIRGDFFAKDNRKLRQEKRKLQAELERAKNTIRKREAELAALKYQWNEVDQGSQKMKMNFLAEGSREYAYAIALL